MESLLGDEEVFSCESRIMAKRAVTFDLTIASRSNF